MGSLSQPATMINPQPCSTMTTPPAASAEQPAAWVNLGALNHAMTMIASRTALAPTDKLVLLRIGMLAADTDGAAWPAAATLAADLGLNRGAVLRSLRRLEKAAALEVAVRRPAQGRGNWNRYRVAGFQPARADVAASAESAHAARIPETTEPPATTESAHAARIPDESAHADAEKSAQLLVCNPIEDQEREREREETTFLNGGEGETTPAAGDVGAAIPEEIAAAWRQKWTLGDKEAAFLRNSIRAYSADEVSRALSIALDSPKEITHPAAYMKTVMQRRMSAIVDAAEAARPRDTSAYLADVRTLAANGHAGAASLLHASQDAPTPAACSTAHTDDQDAPTPAACSTAHTDDQDAPPAPAACSTAHTDDQVSASEEIAHAADVTAAFERARQRMHGETAALLHGANVTNGDGYTITLPAARAADLAWLQTRTPEIRRLMAEERGGSFEEIRFQVAPA